jgi:hypothetical protein
MNAKIKGFLLDTYRVFQKPQNLDKLNGKLTPSMNLPENWNKENPDWNGVEFIISVKEEDFETYQADCASQIKDGLKRRQQELMRFLMGRDSENERSADDMALMEEIAKSGQLSISLHNLANWKEWRGVGRKPVSAETHAKKAIAGFEKKGLSKKEILALMIAQLEEESEEK